MWPFLGLTAKFRVINPLLTVIKFSNEKTAIHYTNEKLIYGWYAIKKKKEKEKTKDV